MRLKPAGIIAIILIIGLLAYFAVRPKIDDIRQENSRELPSNRTTTETTENKTPPPPATKGGTTAEDREFNYTPEEPVNGQLRGVVEVGATDFNSFVINMDNQNRWKIVS